MTSAERNRLPRGFGLWLLLGAAVFWTIDLGVLRAGTPHPLDDVWEYGLVARSLLAGHGFRTAMIHPPIWGLHDASWTVPVLVHGPLLPLIGAPFLAVFGPGVVDQVAWLAAALAAFAAVFTGRVVARRSGVAAGTVAAALVTLSPMMIRMVHHDIAPAAGACFVALVMDLVVRNRPRPFLAGVALGLGALVRPELVLCAPLVAWVLGRGRLAAFLAPLVVPLALWAIHTFRASGSPFFNLSSYLLIAYTRSHEGLSPLFDFRLPPSRFLSAVLAAGPELWRKWAYFGPRTIKLMLIAPGAWLGTVAVIGAAAALREPRTRRLALVALAAAIVPFALSTTTELSERFVAVFLPLWAAGVVRGTDAFGRRPAWIPMLRMATSLAILPFTVATLTRDVRDAAGLRRWYANERSALTTLATRSAKDRVLYSDTPDFAAWTTGRPTVAIHLDACRALRSAGLPADLPVPGSDDEWFHADPSGHPIPSPGRSGRYLSTTTRRTDRLVPNARRR